MRSIKPTGGALRRALVLGAAAVTVTAGVTACSSSSSSSASGSSTGAAGGQAAIDAALQKKSSITVWDWAGITPMVTAFEKKYPNVTVNVVNAGTGNTEYTKLQNAIKAGSGVPDVAQIEYFALPQFALGGSLVNLADYGLDSMKSQYSDAIWGGVNVNGQLVGLPQDSGPMALFYNQKVFTQYGLTVPTTWDEYVADAKKLHAADPTKYITNDVGDPGFVTSMIWDAGGTPFKVTGTTNVSINLQDAGSKKFADEWNQLVSGGDLSPISSWTTQWYQALGNGSIASLVTGAWMPGVFEGSVSGASGDWRVAPMPTWTAGAPAATSQNGGSSDAVLKASKNPLVAAGFVQFLDGQEGETLLANGGGFPSMTSALESASFLNATPAYFGGQKINQVLSAAAKSVISGWSYLPYEVYANSIFPDTVGKAYANKSDLNAALSQWQSSLVSYGQAQGFTVSGS
jgi:multiple sugar transport system substrate-binding protein